MKPLSHARRAKLTFHSMTAVHRVAKHVTSCSDCRNAETRKCNGSWAIACRLGRLCEPKDCPEFKDARRPSFLLHLLVA